jgi:hypothetical protein
MQIIPLKQVDGFVLNDSEEPVVIEKGVFLASAFEEEHYFEGNPSHSGAFFRVYPKKCGYKAYPVSKVLSHYDGIREVFRNYYLVVASRKFKVLQRIGQSRREGQSFTLAKRLTD